MVACYAVDEALLFFPFLFLFFFLSLFRIPELEPKLNLTCLLKAYFSICWREFPRLASPHMRKVTKNSLGKVAKDVAQMFD